MSTALNRPVHRFPGALTVTSPRIGRSNLRSHPHLPVAVQTSNDSRYRFDICVRLVTAESRLALDRMPRTSSSGCPLAPAQARLLTEHVGIEPTERTASASDYHRWGIEPRSSKLLQWRLRESNPRPAPSAVEACHPRWTLRDSNPPVALLLPVYRRPHL